MGNEREKKTVEGKEIQVPTHPKPLDERTKMINHVVYQNPLCCLSQTLHNGPKTRVKVFLIHNFTREGTSPNTQWS